MSYPANSTIEMVEHSPDGHGRELNRPHLTIVADELPLLREGLAALMESTRRYRVVGHCGDGEQAFQLIQELRPDLAILDFGLPGLFSLEIARSVRSAGISTKVVVMSKRCDRKSVSEAVRSGVSAFLPKMAPSSDLVSALDRTMQGLVYVPPSVQLDESLNADDPEPADAFENLSPREFQVFNLMVEGVRAKEIAARLRLSPKTVDTYRSNLMRKLDIHDLPGLVKFAIERELTSRR
jgi:DNA-binding NarL/FixJ family response regulator